MSACQSLPPLQGCWKPSSPSSSSSSGPPHLRGSRASPSRGLSIRRCDRGGRCVHNAARVCIFQRANRCRLLFSPSKPLPHTDKQGARRREEQGKEEEENEWHESYFLLDSLWTRCSASGSTGDGGKEGGRWGKERKGASRKETPHRREERERQKEQSQKLHVFQLFWFHKMESNCSSSSFHYF